MVNITTLTISEPLLQEFKEAILIRYKRHNKGVVRLETENAIRAHIEKLKGNY